MLQLMIKKIMSKNVQVIKKSLQNFKTVIVSNI